MRNRNLDWRHLVGFLIAVYIVYAGFINPRQEPTAGEPTPTKVYSDYKSYDPEYRELQYEATAEAVEQEYLESLFATATAEMQEVYDATIAADQTFEAIVATAQAERVESLTSTVQAWQEIEEAIATWQPWADEDYWEAPE